ncbi:imidazole glycerol phosphate synthase subunit HisH [Thalassolituus alkanivorans]|nr:imidazole glycerol phosphate synthase subunit HisH [Thalassolituus alkanivorans]MAY14341.1 imidazole glycerol phosphate synthase subunit HisH [Oceanospirillaceae bacterium]MCB2385256.1 imidazole glycerol phosphate synthase subunit HisH [Thalassolituus alkanivorans]MCB2421887.1 imidazole glycerol phosphate synthase subunit HisH [Thalassolituus alkanivorans]|tara:strand:+ start:222 stop:842 length:621 start_codon:yes stop_codon:yes gene_type:complete
MIITLIDYGMGNHLSVRNALKRLGYDSSVSQDPAVIKSSDLIILPGVGSFRRAMENLNRLGLSEVIRLAATENGTPTLGICLGMQLLGSESTEDGVCEGLRLIENKITKLDGSSDIRIPHVGFNNVYWETNNDLTVDINQNSDFYFTHSYAMKDDDKTADYIYCDYGMPFVAGFRKENVFGVQFHPEKSQKNGLKLLKNFLEIKRA